MTPTKKNGANIGRKIRFRVVKLLLIFFYHDQIESAISSLRQKDVLAKKEAVDEAIQAPPITERQNLSRYIKLIAPWPARLPSVNHRQKGA
jgi:uncharacterized membrane protein